MRSAVAAALLLFLSACAARQPGPSLDAAVSEAAAPNPREMVSAAAEPYSPELGPPRRKPGLQSAALAKQKLHNSGRWRPESGFWGGPPPPRMKPMIHPVSQPLQCVPYARRLSAINIRGDAWTWWNKAKGRYARGDKPEVGAVLVMSRSKRNIYGHLAVVTEILNDREILVHQANWLNQGRIHRYTPVIDVSPDNDWSAVRVWYVPGQRYGSRTYGVSGFIYPDTLEARR